MLNFGCHFLRRYVQSLDVLIVLFIGKLFRAHGIFRALQIFRTFRIFFIANLIQTEPTLLLMVGQLFAFGIGFQLLFRGALLLVV